MPARISASLSEPTNELGANFFFAKYVFNEHPFSTSYQDWLASSYFRDDRRTLRAAIEAAGLAGISNVKHSPNIARRSKEQYSDALTAVKQALDDPVQAADDATLMAVIILGLYEVRSTSLPLPLFIVLSSKQRQTITFETWDRYRDWATHVQGATALLELRGQEQFTRERGAQLYVQIRSQIVTF